MAAFLGFFFAQVAKVFTHHFITREWDLTRLVGSGGMPSSHTALVMGLTTALGVLQGIGGLYRNETLESWVKKAAKLFTFPSGTLAKNYR